MARHIVCMGVSATGKSTIGKLLAERLGGLEFLEGDDLHTEANRQRMARGIALTDEDRAPWLARIREWMSDQARAGKDTVVACSALKKSYRDVLRQAEGAVIFVHICPPDDLLRKRMADRTGHYMGPDQLDDQLATLEPLEAEEDGFTVANTSSPEAAAAEIASRIDPNP